MLAYCRKNLNHKNNKDFSNSLPLTSPPGEKETTQEENKDL